MKPKEDKNDNHEAKKVFAGHFVIKEKKKTGLHEEIVKYKECRKNHAASLGRYAVDGCCEFMPAGEEGSAAALSCHACSCHRNFHKRETEIELHLHFSIS